MRRLCGVMCLVAAASFASAGVVQQNDFTAAENDTLPANFTADWDAGTDVKVMSLTNLGGIPNFTGGDGYALRLGDLGDTGYNFAYPSNFASLSTADCSVEAKVYVDFAGHTDERDYGLFVHCVPDTTPLYGAQAVYNQSAGYWMFVTANSSWGSYYPTNGRAFILKRGADGASWVQLGSEGTTNIADGWHTFKLEITGTTVKAYVDGNLECQGTDDPLTWAAGFPGMVFYKGAGADDYGVFDNFVFSTPDASVADWSVY